MKRRLSVILCIVLTFAMLLSIAACGTANAAKEKEGVMKTPAKKQATQELLANAAIRTAGQAERSTLFGIVKKVLNGGSIAVNADFSGEDADFESVKATLYTDLANKKGALETTFTSQGVDVRGGAYLADNTLTVDYQWLLGEAYSLNLTNLKQQFNNSIFASPNSAYHLNDEQIETVRAVLDQVEELLAKSGKDAKAEAAMQKLNELFAKCVEENTTIERKQDTVSVLDRDVANAAVITIQANNAQIADLLVAFCGEITADRDITAYLNENLLPVLAQAKLLLASDGTDLQREIPAELSFLTELLDATTMPEFYLALTKGAASLSTLIKSELFKVDLTIRLALNNKTGIIMKGEISANVEVEKGVSASVSAVVELGESLINFEGIRATVSVPGEDPLTVALLVKENTKASLKMEATVSSLGKDPVAELSLNRSTGAFVLNVSSEEDGRTKKASLSGTYTAENGVYTFADMAVTSTDSPASVSSVTIVIKETDTVPAFQGTAKDFMKLTDADFRELMQALDGLFSSENFGL